jgi:hypothetical protein
LRVRPLSLLIALSEEGEVRKDVNDGGGSSMAGLGFGENAAAEARGREALEKLRQGSSERGYDPTLQGLQDRPEDVPVEVPQEFKSTVTLGLAGLLIAGGVVSILAGGSLWEDAPAPTSDAPPGEVAPAFGFVPSAP